MSTGLPVFDTTVQESNVWLKKVEARLKPCDRQQAYGAVRAVFHALRDRLPPEGALGVAAQLPMLLRGVYFEDWRPADGPTDGRSPAAFAAAVEDELPPGFPRQPNEAAEAVFEVMAARLDPGEVHKIMGYLPAPMRTLWPAEYRTV